ncbi:MAG: hypothetical protein O7B99_07915 [Planctomycetota bacterium]|nr:hypothetical protein [Planctomycetota bacterium]
MRSPNLSLDEVEDPEAIELALPLRCEIQVDLSGDPGLADAFRVLDGEGEVLELVATSAAGVWFPEQAGIAGERSDVMGVSEEARTLVLLREGAEVLRISVRAVPGELVVVRP